MSYYIQGNVLKEGYCEVHPHVPEYYPCYICCQEIDRENQRQQHKDEQLQPEQPEPKIYEIDFEGHVLAKIEVYNGELKVLAAMNGYGNAITAKFR